MSKRRNSAALCQARAIIRADLSERALQLLLLLLLLPILLWAVRETVPPPALRDGFSQTVFRLFQGDYRIDPAQRYQLPIVWIFLNAYLAFIVGSFPFGGAEASFLIRTGSKRGWWLSKCLSLSVTAAASYAVIYLSAFAASIIGGEAVAGFDSRSMEAAALPFLTALACSFVQSLLNLLMKPVFSCMAVVSLQIISTYIHSPMLFTGYSQLKRTTLAKPTGISLEAAIPVLLIIVLICAAAGAAIVDKMDFIRIKEQP